MKNLQSSLNKVKTAVINVLLCFWLTST